jgi:hypothetical protein
VWYLRARRNAHSVRDQVWNASSRMTTNEDGS